MVVAILVSENVYNSTPCGTHFSIHELYVLCSGFILRMTLCECTLWPLRGRVVRVGENSMLFFLNIDHVLGRNSVRSIFLGFRNVVLETFNVNVLGILCALQRAT